MQSLQYTPTCHRTIFCGCSNIQQQEGKVMPMVYIYIFLIIVIIIVHVKLSLEWFVNKDFYPLKQKSPLLCILMIISIGLQLMMYPVIFTSNYLTNSFQGVGTKFAFRSVSTGFQFSVYFIYLLRCLRIWYAHQTHKSRKKDIIFTIFKRQQFLAMFIVLLTTIKGIIVVMDPFIYPIGTKLGSKHAHDFSLSFQFGMHRSSNLQPYAIIRTLLYNFFWQILLVYCLLLQKKINQVYSMKKQLILILAMTQLTNVFYICLLALFLQKPSILHQICINQPFPFIDLFKIINLLMALGVTAILPLSSKKQYHILLPTGPHYALITKTIKHFLIQKQFLHVFSKYLKYLDQKQGTTSHIKLLKFWQQVMQKKIDNQRLSDLQKINSINSLITQVQSSIFQKQHELVHSLKQTISIIQPDQNHNQLNKYKISINDKIDRLQKITEDKLSKIYLEQYCKTESFYYLQKIMKDNEEINLKLIMLKMAIIVDTENQFN